jgi:hypothetical protein
MFAPQAECKGQLRMRRNISGGVRGTRRYASEAVILLIEMDEVTDWWRKEAERDAMYPEILHGLGFWPGQPITLNCPTCLRKSWMRLPEQRIAYFINGVTLSCPRACGFYGDLAAFEPVASADDERSQYDTHTICVRCLVEYASDGVVLRRPCCAIETPREVMSDVLKTIENHAAAPKPPSDQTLEMLLSLVVSTFDGVMREMCGIVNRNAEHLHNDGYDALIAFTRPPLDGESSFQNLHAARRRLQAAGWDMAEQVNDWTALVTVFQKRHLYAHKLGVADLAYVTKTNDSSATVGKRVKVTLDEILTAARDCMRLVVNFFGCFLS